MTTVLIVDDVMPMAEQYAYDLQRLGGYETLTASSGDEALERLRRDAIDCVILDLEMPGVDGFQVLRTMQRRGIQVPVIVYTGTGSYDRCIEAINLGAYGFIDKAEPMARVVQEIENALQRRRLNQEVATLRRELGADSAIIGTSESIRRLHEAIARVAPIPSPVLIVGESGSGKELVAWEVHQRSQGSRGPFIALNSASLPEHLVESELFGHERGAFTGADRMRKGAFESATGGSLFLDEIGELPLATQAKLLRVLEQRTVTRVGGTKEIEVDARVIAATNRSLDDDVAQGRFRQDLLFRLNVHVLEVPPLRDRRSDIPALAGHLLEGMCERFGIRPRTLTPEALAALAAYDWRRNNVRELRNVIERMVIASDDDSLGVDAVPVDIVSAGAAGQRGGGAGYQELKAEAERRIVMEALVRHDGHVSKTAEALGLADHASLLKIMRRLGIRRGVES
ncbi:MAG: sigma-54 dependent transcriptional regulator [Gemmatimonadetes bacterium]|nr:sigma-54 dependent transcriptional regulator [Gemmatimonadota bacterium]